MIQTALPLRLYAHSNSEVLDILLKHALIMWQFPVCHSVDGGWGGV